MVQFKENDIPLVMAFIERECKCFEGRREPDFPKKYFDLVVKKIKPIKSMDFITMRTFGNAGCLSRELKLDMFTYGSKFGDNYVLDLCPCGRLEHTAFLSKEAKPK